MSDGGGTRRWTVLVGALLVQVVLGTVYGFSVFVKPLELEFGWERATTQWAFSIALASFALWMIPAGRLQDRIGPRKVAGIGGVLLGVSFLLGSVLLATIREPWALYVTYGLVGGAGIGFAYVCPIAALVKWFPDKKGLITGLAVAGFGAGALFFAGPASELMLPPNDTGERMGISQIILIGLGAAKGEGFGIGWKAFFVLHGLVSLVLVLIGAALLKNPPEGWRPPGWVGPAAGKATRNVTSKEMLGTPLAFVLWLTFAFGATSGLMAIGQWTPMMGAKLAGATFAPEWMGGYGRFIEPVGILALFNALGRIFWGKISDLIDRPRAMMFMYLLQGMAFMLLVSVESHVAIFLASAWVGLNFGGNFALFPAATADYFGVKSLGMNYGYIFTAYGAAGIIGPVVGGVLFDVTGQYVLAFVFSGILCFLAAGCSVVAWGLAHYEERFDSTAARA
ncbi:MAG: OFA family MFS transporter [Candidatus Omnitrophica bacterium]|nr:OFA family MFS transporter [Candidatus Omnitrophota bacterium]